MSAYLNPELDVEARVQDLLSQLTLEEKVSFMIDDAAGVPRLNLPPYHWWNEGLHGVGRSGRATVFPQAIGLAATWDVPLMHKVATAIADEARAKHHAAKKQGRRGIYAGLTYWSPNINIFRDPRWGRGQETYGEDPFLTARMGVAFVKGMQGDDPKYLKVVATPKHFAVHSGPEEGRNAFDAIASPKDMEETYLPAFRACVQEANAQSVMSAYNRLNGVPCSAHDWLLNQTLREKWGFTGFVVSDCGAIENISRHHKTAADDAEAAAQSVKGGCDLCCGRAYEALKEAVSRGLIPEAEVDRALTRLFTALMKLGWFDDDALVPHSRIPESVVDSPQHRELARLAAQKSIVLLKNDGNVLPLAKTVNTVFVTGPNCDVSDVLMGNYNGHNPNMATILEGIVGKVSIGTRVMSFNGCPVAGPYNPGWGVASWEAPQHELIIAVMGLSPKMEGEEGEESLTGKGGDKEVVELPGAQVKYLEFLVGLGKPVVLVLTGGSPMTLPAIAEKIPAILLCWYPGQAGGEAVADVLFGDCNPSGRLPLTFPSAENALPPIESYDMTGRTYKFMDGKPSFAFGYGLSYTRFEYSDLSFDAGRRTARVHVKNVGDRDGEEVVQAYVQDLEASVRVPRHQLAAFGRVHLAPGETKVVELTLNDQELSVVTESGDRVLEPGAFELFVGGGQPGFVATESIRFTL